jgi:hypothetical protein
MQGKSSPSESERGTGRISEVLTTAGTSTKNVKLLSVTANTREDLRAFLAEAVEALVQLRTTSYALADAT